MHDGYKLQCEIIASYALMTKKCCKRELGVINNLRYSTIHALA